MRQVHRVHVEPRVHDRELPLLDAYPVPALENFRAELGIQLEQVDVHVHRLDLLAFGDEPRCQEPPEDPRLAGAHPSPTPTLLETKDWIELFIRNEKILSPDSEISRNFHNLSILSAILNEL